MVQWRPSQSRSGAALANSKVGVELIKDGIECLIPNWKATWSEAFPTGWEFSPLQITPDL